MRGINRSFVTDPEVRAELGTMFTEFATTDGPQLFHCTEGKDRAGWTAAMLLSLVGVDRETVYADYLLTNDYSAERIEATLAAAAEVGDPRRPPCTPRCWGWSEDSSRPDSTSSKRITAQCTIICSPAWA